MENSILTLNAEADAWASLCSNGTIQVYDGTKPLNPQTAITTQNLLCTVDFGTTPFNPADAGSLTLVTSLTGLITAGGTATWFRAFRTDGTTVHVDGTVGVNGSGADAELADVLLVLNDLLELQTVNYTRPAL